VNQLRFRNIGGLIIIDLIDMESRENREKVYRALQDAVRSDKAKTNVLKISELGLVEMTRKRTRENLVQALCEPCPSCEGRGYVLSSESIAFKVMREIRKDVPAFSGREIAVTVAPQVAHQLLGAEGAVLEELSEELGRSIEVRARPGLHQEQFEVSALDQGPPVETTLPWLEARKPDKEAKADKGAKADKADKPDRGAKADKPAKEAKADAADEAGRTDGDEKDSPPAELAAKSASPAPAAPELSPAAPEPEATAQPTAQPAAEPAEEPVIAAQAEEAAPDTPEEAEPRPASDAEVAASPPEPRTAAGSDAPASEVLQALDEPADSRILPGSPSTPLSEES